ncbi:cyclic nucleotide-binding domain protein [Treponema vincentii ATCC 35580]|uniref:Cyclic nucleotide-binding domain protein n=1 Tax=Treponema vincentii ATCC 35580 TaxID=596324 RepID=C8PRV1_9SPIR|nr:Crp/Fnr family transcriptional regulator [Treponema vincentii]EEV19868.1 cyclic nucleotide-binding domain protein [Treponema vincentii ATCC 35580]
MNPLFKDIPTEELKNYLTAVNAKTAVYQKDSFIFFEGDLPKALFILKSGIVQIEKNDIDGKRIIMNRFETPETVFGEVYAFLQSTPYDYSCRIIADAEILSIPATIFSDSAALASVQTKITRNLLSILAHKAYFLNQKLLIFSSFTLRKKIAVYLLQQAHGQPKITLKLNREAMAEYLAVPRPSLSRELMNMQKEKLLTISKDTVSVNINKLEELA